MAFTAFFFLPLLSILALDAIYGFGYRNGFLELMAGSYRARNLSETTEPLQGNMTNTGLDELLGNLIVFYWPVINGNHPALSLQAFYFSGPIVAAWTVIQVESWRDSPRARWLLSPTFWALLSQVIAIGAIVPLWCAIHLWLHPGPRTLSASGAHAVKLLPVCMILGFGIPTLAMILPERWHSHIFTKQTAIAVWQLWPLYASGLHRALRATTSSKGISARQASRHAYNFAFAMAAICHLVSWTLAIGLIPANLLADISPWGVNDREVQVASMAEGALWFLQWDHLTGMGGLLLWALHMHLRELGKESVWTGSWLALKIGALCLVSGPCGAAIRVLMQLSVG